jgi:hypothetical protein
MISARSQEIFIPYVIDFPKGFIIRAVDDFLCFTTIAPRIQMRPCFPCLLIRSFLARFGLSLFLSALTFLSRGFLGKAG